MPGVVGGRADRTPNLGIPQRNGSNTAKSQDWTPPQNTQSMASQVSRTGDKGAGKYLLAVQMAKDKFKEDPDVNDTIFRNSVDDIYNSMKSEGDDTPENLRGESPLQTIGRTIGGAIDTFNTGVGGVLDWVGDNLIGNLVGFFNEDAGNNVKNAFSGEDLAFIPDAAEDIALSLIPGAGIPLAMGKNALQHTDDIAEALSGRDTVTRERLNEWERGGRLLDSALAVGLSAIPGGSNKIASNYVKGLEKSAKKIEEDAAQAALEAASKNSAEEVVQATPIPRKELGNIRESDEFVSAPQVPEEALIPAPLPPASRIAGGSTVPPPNSSRLPTNPSRFPDAIRSVPARTEAPNILDSSDLVMKPGPTPEQIVQDALSAREDLISGLGKESYQTGTKATQDIIDGFQNAFDAREALTAGLGREAYQPTVAATREATNAAQREYIDAIENRSPLRRAMDSLQAFGSMDPRRTALDVAKNRAAKQVRRSAVEELPEIAEEQALRKASDKQASSNFRKLLDTAINMAKNDIVPHKEEGEKLSRAVSRWAKTQTNNIARGISGVPLAALQASAGLSSAYGVDPVTALDILYQQQGGISKNGMGGNWPLGFYLMGVGGRQFTDRLMPNVARRAYAQVGASGAPKMGAHLRADLPFQAARAGAISNQMRQLTAGRNIENPDDYGDFLRMYGNVVPEEGEE